jgi:hypothetical protein
MQRTLPTVLRLGGLALGLAAGGILIALMWPDMMNDLYGAKSLRHFVGMFVMAIVLAGLVSWPFFRLADKFSPEGDSDRVDAGTST